MAQATFNVIQEKCDFGVASGLSIIKKSNHWLPYSKCWEQSHTSHTKVPLKVVKILKGS